MHATLILDIVYFQASLRAVFRNSDLHAGSLSESPASSSHAVSIEPR